jgi:hypothetical protein
VFHHAAVMWRCKDKELQYHTNICKTVIKTHSQHAFILYFRKFNASNNVQVDTITAFHPNFNGRSINKLTLFNWYIQTPPLKTGVMCTWEKWPDITSVLWEGLTVHGYIKIYNHIKDKSVWIYKTTGKIMVLYILIFQCNYTFLIKYCR